MKFLFCLIATLFAVETAVPQNSPSSNELSKLVKEYDNLFGYTRSFVNQLRDTIILDSHLLDRLVSDDKIAAVQLRGANVAVEERSATTDLGLKWVSDATYNFAPGIGENEDVFFRSRVSTGLDWVLLGEGSIKRKIENRRLFQQQVLRDSVQLKINTHAFQIQAKQLFVKHIFDQHRLAILKNYRKIVQMHADYLGRMSQHGLSNAMDHVKINNEVRATDRVIEVYEAYLTPVPPHLEQEYWNLAYSQPILPAMSTISVDQLLKQEESLVRLQKELLVESYTLSEKPSLRAKFRYNYFDNADQQGRSFASVGASLTVPIRFGKDDRTKEYQMASYDNALLNEKLKLKEKLSLQHKSFYLLNSKLLRLQDDVLFIETLLNEEVKIYQQHIKNFSPAKYIKYADMLVQKKLEVLEIKEQLCEEYISFQTLSGFYSETVLH